MTYTSLCEAIMAYAEGLDMYYGTRSEWCDDEIPFEMSMDLSNPAYVAYCEKTHEEYWSKGEQE